MLNWIKSFKSIVNEQFQMVVLVVLSLVAVYDNVGNSRGILSFIQALLPISLILCAIWLLYLSKKFFAAHLMMFIAVFANGISDFARWLFSYHFFFKNFQVTFDLNLVLSLLACAYLILMIISYVMNEGIKLSIVKPVMLWIILIFLAYQYLRFGILSLLLVSLSVLIFLNDDGPELAVLLFLLSSVISTPFIIIGRFVDKIAQFSTIHMWVMDAFALGLIGLSILFFIMQAPKLGFKKKV